MKSKQPDDEHDGNSEFRGESTESSEKAVLNRREYVQLGAAATGSVLITGMSIGATSSSTGSTFSTSFGEYAE